MLLVAMIRFRGFSSMCHVCLCDYESESVGARMHHICGVIVIYPAKANGSYLTSGSLC